MNSLMVNDDVIKVNDEFWCKAILLDQKEKGLKKWTGHGSKDLKVRTGYNF